MFMKSIVMYQLNLPEIWFTKLNHFHSVQSIMTGLLKTLYYEQYLQFSSNYLLLLPFGWNHTLTKLSITHIPIQTHAHISTISVSTVSIRVTCIQSRVITFINVYESREKRNARKEKQKDDIYACLWTALKSTKFTWNLVHWTLLFSSNSKFFDWSFKKPFNEQYLLQFHSTYLLLQSFRWNQRPRNYARILDSRKFSGTETIISYPLLICTLHGTNICRILQKPDHNYTNYQVIKFHKLFTLYITYLLIINVLTVIDINKVYHEIACWGLW